MPQQVTTGPTLMEGVERMNAVVVRGLEQEVRQSAGVPPRRDPFAIEVDWGRNCYTCGGSSPTLLAALSLTSLIISCSNAVYISMLIRRNLIQTLQKSTLQ